jgi:pyruvate dehydrogenase E1 component beta subunit
VVREGTDVTVVAAGYIRHKVVEAAEQLAGGVSVEVIDPRAIVPLDLDTILASVRKTGRLLVVHESPTRCGIGAEIVRRVAAEAFEHLKAPPKVLGGADLPIPFSPGLEQACLPQVGTIAAGIRAMTVS